MQPADHAMRNRAFDIGPRAAAIDHLNQLDQIPMDLDTARGVAIPESHLWIAQHAQQRAAILDMDLADGSR